MSCYRSTIFHIPKYIWISSMYDYACDWLDTYKVSLSRSLAPIVTGQEHLFLFSRSWTSHGKNIPIMW